MHDTRNTEPTEGAATPWERSKEGLVQLLSLVGWLTAQGEMHTGSYCASLLMAVAATTEGRGIPIDIRVGAGYWGLRDAMMNHEPAEHGSFFSFANTLIERAMRLASMDGAPPDDQRSTAAIALAEQLGGRLPASPSGARPSNSRTSRMAGS